jgi:hypothetical protein
MPTDTIETIDPVQLSRVSGGTASSNDQLTAALTQITNSLADLSKNNNQSDPTMMMMMMMMMGGMGGGGGSYVAAAPAGPPVVNVDTSVLGGRGGFGGCARGGCGSKKGW